MVLLSCSTEERWRRRGDGDSSRLAARCQGSGATGHGLQAESNWRADGPTEVLWLSHQGKSATLGLAKNARFLLVPQPPQPLSREAGLQRRSISPRCIAGTHPPPQICPSRPGWQGKFPQKCTPVVMPGWVQSPGAARGSRADIPRVPASGWGPGCTPRRGTEHGGFGCVSLGWHRPWSISRGALVPAGMEKLLSRGSGCRRGRVLTRAVRRVVKKQRCFSRRSYWPLSPCSLYVTHLPSFWISAWEARCTYP